MIKCENLQMVEERFTNVKIREDRISFKLMDEHKKFIKSILIPTAKYPLNDTDISIFTYDNTEIMKDKKYINIIDNITYQVGKCYTNTQNVKEAFDKKKVTNFKTYVGWLFIGIDEAPLHHCWGVLEDKYLIDLADNIDKMYVLNYEEFEGLSMEETRAKYLDYMKAASKKKNSERCFLGKASSLSFYIGCECSPDEGRKIFNELMKTYPGHECKRPTNNDGATGMQQLLVENGLQKM